MRVALILLLTLVISSCVTSAVLSGQRKCAEENRDPKRVEKIDCLGMSAIIAAAKIDAEIAEDISDAVYQEYLSGKKDPLRHEGEDTNLCKENESKICSAKEGCNCEK